jgi:hypothetical protein
MTGTAVEFSVLVQKLQMVLLFSQPDGDNDGSRVWSIRGMMTDKKTE